MPTPTAVRTSRVNVQSLITGCLDDGGCIRRWSGLSTGIVHEGKKL
jgi:hypothetical protein